MLDGEIAVQLGWIESVTWRACQIWITGDCVDTYHSHQLRVFLGVVFFLPTASAVAGEAVDANGTGTIEGVVIYVGEVPKSRTRDDAGQQRRLLAVHRRTKGLRDVLAYLERDKENSARLKDSPANTVVAPAPVVVEQVEHTFRPHLIAIRTGQQVKFTNGDAANHNVHAIGVELQNNFNVMTGATGEYLHQFVLEKKLRPISLRCDLHPWMQGWVYVFDHPFYAVSDEHGKFRIRSVPMGEYRLTIRQPNVGYRKTLAVAVQPQQTTKVQVRLTPDDLKHS